MENEIWKDIPNYEGLYQVSNLGNVKSLNYNNTKKEKLLNPSLTRGYFHLRLSGKTFRIHQLVAITFLNHERCGHKLVIDHINDNSQDNRLENLQIVTARFNVCKTQGAYTSKYKGVSLNKKLNKWVSQIRIKDKTYYLGLFNTEKEAYQVYQNKLKTI